MRKREEEREVRRRETEREKETEGGRDGGKQIYVFWEDVSGYFSSRQWKGGGIDGRVSPRTGTSDRIVPDPLCGHTSWCAWCGNTCSCSFC